MSKLQDCADIIKDIMMYTSDDVRLAKNKLNTAFETMLIFLDHQDLIDIVRGRVLPYLRPKQSALFYDYITRNSPIGKSVMIQPYVNRVELQITN